MSNVVSGFWPDGHERPPASPGPTPITDELNRILGLLGEELPGGSDASVSFSFDGRLHVHIDVPKREDVILVEARLPGIEGGLFHSLSRSATPHRRFCHRISAVVNR